MSLIDGLDLARIFGRRNSTALFTDTDAVINIFYNGTSTLATVETDASGDIILTDDSGVVLTLDISAAISNTVVEAVALINALGNGWKAVSVRALPTDLLDDTGSQIVVSQGAATAKNSGGVNIFWDVSVTKYITAEITNADISNNDDDVGQINEVSYATLQGTGTTPTATIFAVNVNDDTVRTLLTQTITTGTETELVDGNTLEWAGRSGERLLVRVAATNLSAGTIQMKGTSWKHNVTD